MKKNHFLILIIAGVLLTAFSSRVQTRQAHSTTITFGSCSHQDKKQKLWNDISSEDPLLFIWLGDVIYGDTQNLDSLKMKYDKQKSNEHYQHLVSKTQIQGIWDDHDYGKNDAGKELKIKKSSQQLFLDFIGISEDAEVRNQEGIYRSQEFSEDGVNYKIYYLDTRYHRDSITKVFAITTPNETGTILGAAQWAWLEKEMASSKAEINIICSSIQVLSNKHLYEKWANFPNERSRLLDLIASSKIKRPIILSGDRHMGEIATTTHNGATMYEITSSGLTQHWSDHKDEPNPYRMGKMVYESNYGLIKVQNKDGIKITALLKADDGYIQRKEKLVF